MSDIPDSSYILAKADECRQSVSAVLWWLGFDPQYDSPTAITLGGLRIRVQPRSLTFGGPADYPSDEVIFDSEERFVGMSDAAYILVDARWLGWVIVPNIVYAAAKLVRRKGNGYFAVPRSLTLSRQEFITWLRCVRGAPVALRGLESLEVAPESTSDNQAPENGSRAV